MASYNVTLVSEEHDIDQTIECQDNEYILDVAEEKGIDLIIYGTMDNTHDWDYHYEEAIKKNIMKYVEIRR